MSRRGWSRCPAVDGCREPKIIKKNIKKTVETTKNHQKTIKTIKHPVFGTYKPGFWSWKPLFFMVWGVVEGRRWSGWGCWCVSWFIVLCVVLGLFWYFFGIICFWFASAWFLGFPGHFTAWPVGLTCFICSLASINESYILHKTNSWGHFNLQHRFIYIYIYIC